jgi:tetratricopeptide (TPR) repeat protein
MLDSRRRRFTCARILCVAISLVVAVGCGPSDPLEKVRALQDEKGDYQGSLEPLRELIESRPDDPEVHYRYGNALIATGNVGLAVLPLEKAIESPDWLERAGLTLAAALISQGAIDQGSAICNRILEQKPDHVPALLLRAKAGMLGRRAYEQVLADADHVRKLEPENEEALAIRVVALLGLMRVEEGGAALEEIEALHRDDSLGLHGSPALCLARATFAKEKGEAELAEKRFEGCLEQFPTEGLVMSGAIAHFDGSGRPERSEAILKHALELAPEASSYRLSLALRIAAAGRVEEAEALLRAGIEAAPPGETAEAWAVVASFNVDHGDLDDAIAAFAKARELDTAESPQLLLGYADALVIAKRFDEAEQLVGRIKVPAYQAILRGRIELERGNPAAALKRFDEGMRLWPNNAVARYYTAIAAEQQGDFARAIEEYRYAMRIDVNETDAYLRQARLHAAAGHYQAALDTLAFEPGGRPEELAAALLQMRIRARMGQKEREMPPWLRGILARPEHRGAMVAALGEGVRERSGPEAALAAMKAVRPLDLSDPIHVEALAAIIEDLAATGRAKEGLALVDAGLRKHPDAAPFLALRGRALHLSGAEVASVREAFERALALDAKNGIALVGLARLEADAGSKEAALGLYDRAISEDEDDRTAAREAAALLVALGRPGDAEQRLATLLREHPYDAEAARALAELRLARGAQDEQTLALARRAVVFQGGSEAEALLERIKPREEQPGPSAVSGK